jgi:hypothetical protein
LILEGSDVESNCAGSFVSVFRYVLAQTGRNTTEISSLQAPTTLPIVFTKTVCADHSHIGDAVLARTTQSVRLADGTTVPSGSPITGHIVSATPFVYDKTPYAHQKQSNLSIQFDSLELSGRTLPLNITVRAMAGPIASWDARTPNVNDAVSPSPSNTQIGGDQFNRSQPEVVSMQGDVVAYNRRGGVYAHLIANGGCDASSVEVSVGIYSASACGLYGFAEISAVEMGSLAKPSMLTLVSARTTPKISKNSTALLEVLPDRQTVASR